MNAFSKSLVAVLLGLGGAAAHADATFTNFASYALGQLPGGADARTPGAYNQWWVPDNAATFGEIRDGVGLGGTRGLVIGNRGNGSDGVIDNVKSGRLMDAAGETTTGAPNTIFESSYWFRTAQTQAPAEYRFRSETYGTDRTTFLGFQNDTSGNLTSIAFEMDLTGNFVQRTLATNLNWGEWYRVTTSIVFVDGAANDVVTQTILDVGNNVVGTATLGTWEQGQRLFGYNGGNLVTPDAVQFHARRSCSASCSPLTSGPYDVAYIDDMSWSTRSLQRVSEPATLVLALAALGVGASVRRRRR